MVNYNNILLYKITIFQNPLRGYFNFKTCFWTKNERNFYIIISKFTQIYWLNRLVFKTSLKLVVELLKLLLKGKKICLKNSKKLTKLMFWCIWNTDWWKNWARKLATIRIAKIMQKKTLLMIWWNVTGEEVESPKGFSKSVILKSKIGVI